MLLRKSFFCLFFCPFLLLTFSFAQNSNTAFQQKWMEIDSLIKVKNLSQTALNKVNILYLLAKQENNHVQQIKCLIYRLNLEGRIKETDPNRNVNAIETELGYTGNITDRSILYCLLAKQYQIYFNNNRWRLYNRSQTTGYKKEDITTWSAGDFHQAITRYYLLALNAANILQQTKVTSYNAVIIKGNAEKLRPTLYDLLAHEALAYFKTGEAYIIRPAYAFVIDNPKALAKMNTFPDEKFTSGDSVSHLLISLQLFQQLIALHKKDAEPDALIDVDIERITWVYQQAVFTGKEKEYQEALKDIITSFPDNQASAEAWYLLADAEADRARTYTPFGDTTHRFDYLQAVQIAEKALSQFKEVDNTGISHLKNLIAEINQKNIQLQTELVNIPGKPFRTLVSYRNVDTLYGRIINISNNDSFRDKAYGKVLWNYVKTLPFVNSFAQKLPYTNDYQEHTAEIKIDVLPVGKYALLTGSGNNFNDTSDKMAIQFFFVSNISYISNNGDFFLLNRQTGQPLENVRVKIIHNSYNNKTYRIQCDTLLRKTNSNGYFKVGSKDNYNNFEFIFTTKTDSLHLREENLYYQKNSEEEDKENYSLKEVKDYEKDKAKFYFFTDRAIYRPGQTVYFKAIAITKDYTTGNNKLFITKDSIQLYLKDASNKTIDSIKLFLNEYGSLTSRFKIPENTLTGEFSIEPKYYDKTNNRLSVEEYKRPAFYVEFEKVKESYRLNDSITVIGTVKAYNGTTIIGATVKYAIQRNVRVTDDWIWRKGSRPYSNNRQAGHGEITTNSEGKFSIKFKAISEGENETATDLLFDFNIDAEVTDINGETHSNKTQVTVGNKSLIVQIDAPQISEADSLKKIFISTKNLNNEKVSAKVSVRLSLLQTQERLIRKRLWERPDQFVMDKDEFIKYFPNDEYKDESDYHTWPVNKVISEKEINTDDLSSFNVQNTVFTPGWYKIEATATDKDGKEVKDVKFIQLFSRAGSQTPVPCYQFNYTINKYTKTGQSAQFIMGTAAQRIFVIQQINKPKNSYPQGKIYHFIYYNKGLINLNYKINEHGGWSINETYVYDNRLYTYQYNIIVPWDNKDLQVNMVTYRNKTEPGSKEQWKITIKDGKKKKVAAELLTGMYDASLDQFRKQDWDIPDIWNIRFAGNGFYAGHNFGNNFSTGNYNHNGIKGTKLIYDQLAYEGNILRDVIIGYGAGKNFSGVGSPVQIRGMNTVNPNSNPLIIVDGNITNTRLENINAGDILSITILKDESATALYGSRAIDGVIIITTKNGAGQLQGQPVRIRKNFSETAFFFPQLQADSLGNYSLNFTMPETLTRWKWMSFAHTKDLAFGNQSTFITTQKTLMVQPNAPRFMREGDQMEFSGKVVNLSNKELTGQVSLELTDATTGVSVDGWFQNIFPVQYFTIGAGQNSEIKFPVQVPFNYNKPLTWKVIAKAGNYSDGEENTLPVLTNRMLVTESLPLFIKGDTVQHFTFSKLFNNNSESLTHEAVTVEYTSNPVWYAVQALPYLMEYPYECAEQTFNRLYANTLAASILNKYPGFKTVFETWKNDTAALQSNLQKNEELKQILLEETPWITGAEKEEQQKKNLALLFDLAKMSNGTTAALEKLKQMQSPNGSFSWFKGGQEDRYITNYIITGIGKLKKTGALSKETEDKTASLLNNALIYLDNKAEEDYRDLLQNKADTSKQNISTQQIQYLYMRSFFPHDSLSGKDAYNYYYRQAKRFWNKQNLYNQALLGLVFYRNNDRQITLGSIIPIITENAINNNEQGMYWKETYTSFWYQSPIEYQSLMIDLLNEINQEEKNAALAVSVNRMKTWLLLNKQTNNWKTTVATADACYALLLNGDNLWGSKQQVKIQLGNTTFSNNQEITEAGTGYFKKRIEGRSVKAEMGNITVSTTSGNQHPDTGISYGSICWSYFEDMDKITEASSPLSLHKKLFIENTTDKGKELTPVNENDEVKVGDKVIVQIELKSDRDMEYLHLKDTRAAGMEPVNVLSGYKWQDGLGYYEATKDASTNFFIGDLKKGTYVFEYPLYVTHTGIFSAGIAMIQCMYAPEFTSHSEGIKIRVIPNH